jgi:hypothetical protein
MKKLYLFLVLTISCVFLGETISQENTTKPLAAYKLDGLWHFIDYDGNELFPPVELENLMGCSEGMFCVSRLVDRKEKWGYMNNKGEMIIKPQYDKAMLFNEGYAVVFEFNNNLRLPVICSIIDKNGKKINSDNLIEAYGFSEGLAYVFTDKMFSGYIDTSGNTVINLGNSLGNKFSEGLAAISNENMKFGYINKNGENVIKYSYEQADAFSEGLAAVNYDTKFGYIDKTGEFRIKPEHDYAHEFKEGRALVGNLYPYFMKTRWGVIDTLGNFIVDYIYPEANGYSEGLASVRDSVSWGFIDKNGNYVIESQFYYTGNFVDGIAWASKKNEKLYGFINRKGDFILEINNFDKIIDLRLNKRMY